MAFFQVCNILGLLMLAGGLLLTFVGCGKNNSALVIDPTKNSENVIAQLAHLFPAADAKVKQSLDGLAQSLKAKDYEGVVVGIDVLNATPGINFDQAQYLNGLRRGVVRRIGEGVAHGDPDAVRAKQMLKRAH